MKQESQRKQIRGVQGIWAHYINVFKDFDAALDPHNTASVSETLLRICTTPLVSGFASYHSYSSIAQDRRATMFESYLTIDRLLSLAESLGAANLDTRAFPVKALWIGAGRK